VTELGQLRSHWQEFLDRGVEIAAVSVDPPDVSERLRQRLALPIHFLADERGTLMDALAIRHRDQAPPAFMAGRPITSRDVYVPTTFLVDEEGVIRWIYRPDTFRVRAPAEALLQAVDALG
jgi:peroxiredoxin